MGLQVGIISFRNNRVMALDLCPKCIFGQYLKNKQTHFNKNLHMHCTDIGIGEEWYGIASGIISFRNNIVMRVWMGFIDYRLMALFFVDY